MLASHKIKEGKGTFSYYENYHKIIKTRTSLLPLSLHMFDFGNLSPLNIQSVTSPNHHHDFPQK